MGITKRIDGKIYTFWSRHKTKSNAVKTAKNMRADGWLARVYKNTNKFKTKKERSHPWEVYVRTKPQKGPLFRLRRKK